MKSSRTRPRARRGAALIATASAAALLAGCTGGTGAAPAEQAMIAPENLPAYVPVDLAAPDYPGVNGSTPGYLSLPTLTKAFDAPPGDGGSYTAMTPLWGTIPPTSGNSYFEAVNAAMGVDLDFQISDGTVYGDKLAAVLASPKDMADWVSIPTWNVPPRFGQAVDSVFEDLTPYLAGDLVEQYPYLANIPTEAWKTCSWNGKVYGLPFPQDVGVGNWAFYRSDLVPDATMPTNADEVIDFVTEQTKDGRWGTNDLWTTAVQMFGVPSKWAIGDDGELINRVETPQYRAALEWMAELYASGAVHPDAVADNKADEGQRFESGQVVVSSPGVGYWHEALTRNRAVDPSFEMTPFPLIAADGGDPVVYKASGATICSYFKKNSDEEAIGELLSAADFLAAPFGTEEYQLINYGVEGEHYTLDSDGLPVPTALAQTEVQPSYIFLVDPPAVNAKVSLPDYVTASSEWTARNAEFIVEPPFYGMNVTEPNRFASLDQPFDDLEKDIARGRKSIDDLDAAIATWRSSGGDDLRALYQDILDANPDAAGTGTPRS
jgi:putative aldouronate transport system substrate-binding protein